jgi:hypothetical protein
MANTIPALSVPYGRTSYWDELNQKKAQGYTLSDKQALSMAYGERYGELSNEMNRQKINRDIAIRSEELDLRKNDQAFQQGITREKMSAADAIANKQFYGQLAGLGVSAALNWDKLGPLWDKVYGKGEDLWNKTWGGVNPNPAMEDPWGGNIDQMPSAIDPYSFDYSGLDAYDYANFADIGTDIGSGAYDFAYGGLDAYDYANFGGDIAGGAADYSMPYYSIAKYGSIAANEIAKELDFQPLLNITEPVTGMFNAISTSMSALFGPDGLGNLFDW